MINMSENWIEALGTINHIQLWGEDMATTIDELHEKMIELERKFSYYNQSSDVGRLNTMAGKEPVTVSPEVYTVIMEAVEVNKISPVFNPLVRPVLSKWYETDKKGRLIDRFNIRQLTNSKGILFKENNQVMLAKKGQQLDLGAIAKGYIADCLLEEAKNKGANQAIINLGGDIAVFSDTKKKFKIGIRDPFAKNDEMIAIVGMERGSISTSGIYERYNRKKGMSANHLVHLEKRKPVSNNLLSVSVIANNAIKSDAFATVLHILGIEESRRLIEKYSLEAIFFTKENEIIATKGVEKQLIQTRKKVKWV